MKKYYIKMNNNKDYLSLGNIISTIKDISNNKNAMQIEIFCSIFDENNINTTTVNNYCIGIRAIGLEYKKLFLDKYNSDKSLFIGNILSLVSILDDRVYSIGEDSLEVINSSEKLKRVIKELLTICSNDKSVSSKFISNIKKLDSFNCMVELLNYAININKQPVYTQNINIKINKDELDEYLKIKLYYGQSYITSLIDLANKGNMYASADVGSMWFDGSISGEVDYLKCFEYYMIAANKNHPKACWMIANLMLTGRVKYDEEVMWKYLNKSITLGSAAGYNTLGLCYLKGLTPDKKIDVDKAKYYFELSSNLGYIFAFNNLGRLYEDSNIEEAIKYYKISADIGNSWALNKMGEYYRLNNDYKTALMYYNKAIDCPINERSAFAYYNLAKYYYENGCKSVKIEADKIKAEYYYSMYDKLKE